MARYNFSDAERYAIWTVRAESCWICGEPVSYSAVEIDHIVPESPLGSDRLAEVLHVFGLPGDFDLNCWSNWMPTHGRCNGAKRERVFKPSPLIQLNLEKAAERGKRCAASTLTSLLKIGRDHLPVADAGDIDAPWSLFALSL